MSRPLRIEYPGANYHVMNRGLGRTRIFINDKDRESFLQLMGEIARLWQVGIHAYCLMTDHYHLLLETPQGNLSRIMRHLDGLYTQRFNRSHDRDGPLFRGRYRAILVDAEEYFLSVARYIHQNPRESGLVSQIQDYPWSSHRAYLHGRHSPLWLDRQVMLSRFGTGATAVRGYRGFMEVGVERDIRDFYRKGKLSPVLGGKKFLERVRNRIGERANRRDDVPESRWVFSSGVDEILSATRRVYGKKVEELLKTRRGTENEARAMAIYLCRTIGGHKLSAIAKAVGFKNYSSASSSYLAMKARIENEKRLARRARQVEEYLKSQKQT